MGQGGSVEAGPDPRSTLQQQISLAIQADHWAEVKEMMSRPGVSPNKPFCMVEEGNLMQDPQWTTPLFYALICNSENPNTLFYILENPNVEVNHAVGGVYPLDFAVLHCRDILVATLLKCERLDVNLSARKVPPFTEVFLRRKGELVDLFLQRRNLKNGFIEVVKTVLEAQVLPESYKKLVLHPSFGECATDAMIHALRRRNTPAAMVTLTSPHLNVNQALNDKAQNLTPLMLAIEQNNIKVVRSLMQHPKISPNRGKTLTPLQLAVKKGSLAAVQALLGHPDIEVNAAYGETPLTLAVLNGEVEILEALLQAPGLKPNLINASGPHAHTSALYICVTRLERAGPGREFGLKMLDLLLDHPTIDPRIGLGDRIPLKFAEAQQDQELLDLLNQKVYFLNNPDQAKIHYEAKAEAKAAAAAEEAKANAQPQQPVAQQEVEVQPTTTTASAAPAAPAAPEGDAASSSRVVGHAPSLDSNDLALARSTSESAFAGVSLNVEQPVSPLRPPTLTSTEARATVMLLPMPSFGDTSSGDIPRPVKVGQQPAPQVTQRFVGSPEVVRGGEQQ